MNQQSVVRQKAAASQRRRTAAVSAATFAAPALPVRHQPPAAFRFSPPPPAVVVAAAARAAGAALAGPSGTDTAAAAAAAAAAAPLIPPFVRPPHKLVWESNVAAFPELGAVWAAFLDICRTSPWRSGADPQLAAALAVPEVRRHRVDCVAGAFDSEYYSALEFSGKFSRGRSSGGCGTREGARLYSGRKYVVPPIRSDVSKDRKGGSGSSCRFDGRFRRCSSSSSSSTSGSRHGGSRSGTGHGGGKVPWLFRHAKYEYAGPPLDPQFARLRAQLGAVFHDELVAMRGLFYYPPGGLRGWHTNVHDPHGWRLYFVHTTSSPTGATHPTAAVAAAATPVAPHSTVPGQRRRVDRGGGSEDDGLGVDNDDTFFTMKDPWTGEVQRSPDADGTLRLFRIAGAPPLWHAVCGGVREHRWSLGIQITGRAAWLLSMAMDARGRAVAGTGGGTRRRWRGAAAGALDSPTPSLGSFLTTHC